MRLVGEQVLLRVYLESADRTPHEPTWRRVVKGARSRGLAGCTVLEGIYGLGTRGILEPSTWGVVRHVPVIVEIVDGARRVAEFVDQVLGAMLERGLVTLERAAVLTYRHGKGETEGMPPLPGMVTPLSTLPAIQPRDHMTIDEDGMLLRVFIGESDRWEDGPLYEGIVRKARELGVAGATVLRGTEGFGAHSVVHKARLLEMSADLPIVVEMVDSRSKIEALVPELDGMVREGMITMENVRVLAYRAPEGKA
jgi:PII-like signaling protein